MRTRMRRWGLWGAAGAVGVALLRWSGPGIPAINPGEEGPPEAILVRPPPSLTAEPGSRSTRWATSRPGRQPGVAPLPITDDASSDLGSALDPPDSAEVVEALAAAAPEACLEAEIERLAHEADPTRSPALLAPLARRLAEIAPLDAARLSDRLPEGAAQAEARRQVAIAWVPADPGAALTWARSLSDSDQRDGVLVAAAYQLAAEQPLQALLVALETAPGPDQEGLLGHTLMQWVSQDSATAIEWAEAIPPGPQRDRVLEPLVTALADRQPEAAAVLVATAFSPGAPQERAAVGVLQRWVQTDPLGAHSWVQQFPEGPTRNAAARSLLDICQPVAIPPDSPTPDDSDGLP